jgi:hypothetical protein
MAIRGAGASYKLAHPSTGALTEVAIWCNDISGDTNTDELDGTVFTPGAIQPVKITIYGATERTRTLTGRWRPAAETFFNALAGRQGVAYEYAPEGVSTGKIRIVGSCNVGAWSGPQQEVNGLIVFTVNISETSRLVETVPASPPATVSITSSSVGDPTVITSAAHSLVTGDVITIAGHTGSTPAINGAWPVTVLTATTFEIPVAVTVGGTGGTIQN